jgi:hypothetical protein
MSARQAAVHAPRRPARAGTQPAAALPSPEAEPASSAWREHDLLVRRFQLAGLTPTEIAVVLHSKGLRVRNWHVSETFVRGRLKALGMTPNPSRELYKQHINVYRRRLPAA